MTEHHDLGRKGELVAAEHLGKAGYRILHKNWRSGRKELDVVAENSEFIVFVEVKTRTDNFPVLPARDLVSPEKQRSVQFAAEAYIKCYGITKEYRFDVVTIRSSGKTMEIDHIPGAFYPTLR